MYVAYRVELGSSLVWEWKQVSMQHSEILKLCGVSVHLYSTNSHDQIASLSFTNQRWDLDANKTTVCSFLEEALLGRLGPVLSSSI